jgi:D-lactate dehydrogenase
MDDTLIDWLSGLDLLKHTKRPTLQLFASACKRRQLGADEALFRQGEPGEFLFLVQAGALNAFAQHSAGESLLRTLGPGEFGGLTSITLDQPRSATLRAVGAATVWTISRADTLGLLERCPDFARSLIVALSAKERRKTRRLASLMGPEASQRFRIAFFDTKPYDRDSFEPLLDPDLYASWFGARLDVHTAELASGHQAVCAFVNDDLSAPTLQRLAQLGVGVVALRCAGYNNVDLEVADQLELSVVRVPAYSPHAVAEHALALLLAINRKTHRAFNRVREGNFSLTGLVGADLYGRTAGVVGLGKIGQCCAAILRGLGMRVLAYDVAPDLEFVRQHQITLCELETLLAESDVISLHTPLTRETHHLIDAERLAHMKQGVLLINTSRGGLVDARALIEALKSGRVGGAGLDVYEEEGGYFFEDHSSGVINDDLLARLMTFNNVLITSHQAFLTTEALHNIAETTLANLRQFAAGGGALDNRVRSAPA